MAALYRVAIYIPTAILRPGDSALTTIDDATVQAIEATAAQFPVTMATYSHDRIQITTRIIPVYEPIGVNQITYRDDAVQWYISPGKMAALRGDRDDFDLFAVYAPASMVNADTFSGIATSDGFWAQSDDDRIDRIGPHEFGHWIGIWLDSQGYTNWPSSPGDDTISGIHSATAYGYVDDVDPAWLEAFFTGTVDGSLGVTDDALALPTPTQDGVKSLRAPALETFTPLALFAPDVSRNRSGSVTPTVVGSVPVVAGQYGPAWDATTSSSNRVFVPRAGNFSDPEGTIMLRCRWTSAADYDSFPVSLGNTTNMLLGRRGGAGNNNHLYAAIGSNGGEIPTSVADGEWVTVAMRWNVANDETTLWKDGHIIARFGCADPSDSATFYLAKGDAEVEGVLVYDTAVSDAAMHRIMTISGAWNWDNVQPRIRIEPSVTSGDSSGMTIRHELWRATLDNVLVEDVSAYLTGGEISLNHDRAITSTARFDLRDIGVVEPETDYLAIFLNRGYDNGAPATRDQLGLFTTTVPPGTRSLVKAEGTQTGDDLTAVLRRYAFDDTYNVAQGTNIVTAVAAIMVLAGITRHTIPAHDATAATAISFGFGTTYLDACNQLLDRIGYYHLSATRDGRLTSGPSRNIQYVEPFRIVTDSDVQGDIDTQPFNTGVANIVLVIQDNLIDPPLTGIARNDAVDSPTSTVNLGVRTRTEQRSDLDSQTAVDALAERLLAEGRTYYQTAQLMLLPDPDVLDTHQTIELDLTGEMSILSGRWWVRTASMGFTPDTAAPVLEINRVTSSVEGSIV